MKSRSPTKLTVPAFTPVPRRKPRHDGWTAERQAAFLEALAETGSVKHAAARINMAPEGAYALRRQPGAESFCTAWDAALDHGVQSLRDLAIDRAKEGVEVPVYSYGKLVGTRRVYNDRLLMFTIKHRLGRLGAEDPAPLRPGTRSLQTRAREDAGARERWYAEYEEELKQFVGGLAQQAASMGRMLRWALEQEARARDAGLFDGEDAYARAADKLFERLGKDPDHWAAHRDEVRDVTEEALACREVSIFPIAGAKDVEHGPTYHQRRDARTEAQILIERGRRMWRAAMQESSWADWRASEG